MKCKYYIAKRFFPEEDYFQYRNGIKQDEIVTLDHSLCEKKFLKSFVIEDELEVTFYLEDVKKYKLDNDEQIIKYLKISNDDDYIQEGDDSFEFCGYDITYRDDESILTNYGVLYDESDNRLFTKYGLVNTLENTRALIMKKKYEIYDLENDDYTIYKVWRYTDMME